MFPTKKNVTTPQKDTSYGSNVNSPGILSNHGDNNTCPRCRNPLDSTVCTNCWYVKKAQVQLPAVKPPAYAHQPYTPRSYGRPGVPGRKTEIPIEVSSTPATTSNHTQPVLRETPRVVYREPSKREDWALPQVMIDNSRELLNYIYSKHGPNVRITPAIMADAMQKLTMGFSKYSYASNAPKKVLDESTFPRKTEVS